MEHTISSVVAENGSPRMRTIASPSRDKKLTASTEFPKNYLFKS